MKILITMKLLDINMKTHLLPLIHLNTVEKIIIVRDFVGPDLHKVEYVIPPKWTIKVPPFNFFFKFLLLLKLSLKIKPDLILAYRLFPHGFLALIAGKMTGVRTAVNLNAGIREVHSINSQIGCYAYTRKMPELTSIGKTLLEVLKSFDVIVVGGSYSKKYLIQLGIHHSKIYILYKPVDPMFKPMNMQKIFDVIYIGRLSEEKHVETLIRATRIISEKNSAIKVGIVGDGPEMKKLIQLSHDLNIDQKVAFLGWKNDPWNWFNKARISVLTSEREGFAQSVVQSLQCGIPVVTTACGDVCDVVRSDFNGSVIGDYLDHEGLAKEIENLLGNPQLLEQYTNNALKTVEVYFSMQSVISLWIQIFNYLSSDSR